MSQCVRSAHTTRLKAVLAYSEHGLVLIKVQTKTAVYVAVSCSDHDLNRVNVGILLRM